MNFKFSETKFQKIYVIVLTVIIMTNNLEIEFKNLLTNTEFQNILQQYPFEPPFIQTNIYFDTPTQTLKQRHMGLRMRLFATSAEQTLKIPAQQADHQLIEITDRLTLQQAQQLSQASKILIPSTVSQKLTALNINAVPLIIIGHAKTTRQLAQVPAGLLTLDQTDYPDGAQDYEIELELQSDHHLQESTQFFQELLQQFQIPNRHVVNKVVRSTQHFVL